MLDISVDTRVLTPRQMTQLSERALGVGYTLADIYDVLVWMNERSQGYPPVEFLGDV